MIKPTFSLPTPKGPRRGLFTFLFLGRLLVYFSFNLLYKVFGCLGLLQDGDFYAKKQSHVKAASILSLWEVKTSREDCAE